MRSCNVGQLSPLCVPSRKSKLSHQRGILNVVVERQPLYAVERLEYNLSQPIRSLSKGNKQKVGLIQALMGKPELIIMDEPTSSLDPLMQQEFYHLVKEVKAEGRTVFISSHNLPDLEDIFLSYCCKEEGERHVA